MRTKILIVTVIVGSFLSSCGQNTANTAQLAKSDSIQVSPEDLVIQPIAASDQTKTIAKDISQEEFTAMLLAKDVNIIDVRTPQEFSQGNIRNSININSTDPELEVKLSSLDKNEPYVLYCVSARRSAGVMKVMKEKGFKEIYNLQGGYPAYAASNK